MKYLTYSGNNIINAELPETASVFFPRPPLAGIPNKDIPQKVKDAFESPLDMPPLEELVQPSSKILIAFDDNCQPFPATKPPDIRQLAIETLLEIL